MEKGEILYHDSSRYIQWQFNALDLYSLLGNGALYKSPQFIFLDSSWTLQFMSCSKQNKCSVYLPKDNSRTSQHLITAQIGIQVTDCNVYESRTFMHMFKDEASIYEIDRFVPLAILKTHVGNLPFCHPVRFFCWLSSTKAAPIEVDTHKMQTEDKDVCTGTLKEYFKKTAGKVSVETQTEFSSSDNAVSTGKLEVDLKKTKLKVCAATQTIFPLPGEHKLSQDFKDLFSSSEETDVTLRVQSRDFKSHRAILAARSTVFAAMFKHDMKERNTGLVLIEDYEPGDFEKFLAYLYTGSIHTLTEDNALSLYKIADKYDSPDLKKNCVDFLSSTLSLETFCDVAKFSLQYNESALLEEAVNFFVKNIRKISLSVKWQTFLKENPLQANEFNLKALDYHGICE